MEKPLLTESEGRMAKRHLNKRLIEGIQATSKLQEFSDDKVRGLSLLVTPKGAKTYYAVRKFKGKVERTKVGRFPETSLKVARQRVGRIQSQYDDGVSPLEAKKKDRMDIDLNAFFEIYYRDHCRQRNKRPETARYNYEKYLAPDLGKMKLSGIERLDIQKVIQRIGLEGHRRNANIMHSLIRAMLNKAIAWELRPEPNPALHIQRYPEKSRDRFMSKSELQRFHIALREEPNDTNRDVIYLLLLTGARKSEALTMRWSDIDFDDQLWRIPDPKNGTPRRVVLADELVLMLRRRRQDYADQSLWVFPGGGKTGHLEGIKKAWGRLLENAAIENFRLHDLRRTLASWMLANGQGLPLIGEVLGHKDYQSTLVYARLDTRPLRGPVSEVARQLALTKL